MSSRTTPPSNSRYSPIGHIQKTEDQTFIVLDKKHQPGLLGVDGYSHIHMFWWFDKNDTPEKRAVLQVHPMGNRENPRTGVFATRSPMRPNLIALTLCKVVAVKDNMIEIEKTDAATLTARVEEAIAVARKAWELTHRDPPGNPIAATAERSVIGILAAGILNHVQCTSKEKAPTA